MKKTLLVYIIFILAVNISFSQVDTQSQNLSFEEKVAEGKAYINETFPDCDVEFFAPHSPFVEKTKDESSERLTKEEWVNQYPHEYELYNYYNKLVYEASLTPEERQEIERKNQEKIKELENK